MAINIKNREAERLLAALSRKTGKGKTRIVLELLRQQSGHLTRLAAVDERRARIKSLARRAARKMRRRNLTDDELIGYDHRGLPA